MKENDLLFNRLPDFNYDPQKWEGAMGTGSLPRETGNSGEM